MRSSYPDASIRLSTGRLSPTGCIHRPPSSAFLTADDGTKLRLWHRLPSSSPLQQTHLVNNHLQRWSTSCVASARSYPSIPKIPTPGTCGTPSHALACMPSIPHTRTLPSLSDRAAYDLWGFAAGHKTLPLPSTGKTDDALLLSLRVTSAPRRFQQHRCHALGFHLCRKNAAGSTAWS